MPVRQPKTHYTRRKDILKDAPEPKTVAQFKPAKIKLDRLDNPDKKRDAQRDKSKAYISENERMALAQSWLMKT